MKTKLKPRPLHTFFLNILLLVCVVYLSVLYYIWNVNLREIRINLDHLNSVLVQSVRTTLKGHELILRGLGQELITLGALDNPENGRDLIERMNEIDPGMAGFGLARSDGQLVLISGIPAGSKLPNLATWVQTRDSFAEVLEKKQMRTGRPFFFEQLDNWVIPIRAPVFNAEGEMIAVMAAGYDINKATTAWVDPELPPGIVVGLMRDDGYLIFLHPIQAAGTRHEQLTLTYGRPVVESTQQAIKALRGQKSFMPLQTPNGMELERYIAYDYVEEYGLHAGVLINRSAIIDAWLQRLIAPSLIFLAFLIGGGLAFRHAIRRQARADSEIAKLTAWQDAVLDAADYSIISTDTEGNIVSFNKAAERMLGYRASEMVGQVTPEVIHDRAEVEQRTNELCQSTGQNLAPGFETFVNSVREGGIDEREWTYVRKDGSKFPVFLSVTSMHSDAGDVIGFLGIGADLTEKKAIQESLQESEDRYQNLYQNANDAIFLLADNRIVDCNPATLELFACDKDQLLGLTPLDFSPQYQADGMLTADAVELKLRALDADKKLRFEWRHQTADGHEFDAEVSLSQVTIGHKPHLLASVRDITERKRIEAQLEYQASHDSLTGLLNRTSLHQAFLRSLASKKSETEIALMLLDLDRFKDINDTLGHHVGDEVLKQIGPRLHSICESCSHIISRLGGDEFAILLWSDKDRDEVLKLAHDVVDRLCQPFNAGGFQVSIGVSIGVAKYPEHGADSHELMRAADVAMYQAKKLSLGVILYDREFDQHSTQRLAFATELVQAIDENQLVLHYQPKIDLKSGVVTGFEALVRWQHPQQGLLYPDAFIDLVEVSEVIHPFTRAVIAIAVKEKKLLQARGFNQPVAVNLSARNLLDDTCYQSLMAALEAENLSTEAVELELTESALMHDPIGASTLLQQFSQAGLNIAIDDFGTGYSSLAYLRRLPVAALKIDRTFVMDMLDNNADQAIVRSTIALAHSLDLTVVAEGVENDQVLDLLKDLDCDQAQGYGICRPQPLEKLMDWLNRNHAAKSGTVS